MLGMRKLATAFIWLTGTAATVLAIYVLWFFAIPYFMAADNLDRAEAQMILRSELQRYRQRQYPELAQLVGNRERKEIAGRSGARYQVVVSGHWDGKANQDVRVIAAIDNGGRSAWIPMTDSFILNPSGKFVGE
jgi:hypothetical protein